MITQKNTAIIIPARLAASRLPNKPLIMIHDKPMIQHVWEKANQSNLGKVIVATDSEEIQKVIDQMQENADDNNLISNELMQKYDEFQNLLTEIMTPELLEAMETIQELSQSPNLDELLDQLNNFEDSLSQFEEQIDRFIDMFEQAIAEQKIDEMIKKIESMLDQQIDILDMVLIINIILYEPNPSEEILCSADINQDNVINILDIVELINWILD